MTELKTKLNDANVEEFLNTIKDEKRKNDCFTVLEMMKKITKAEPKMWRTSIVGFGKYHYKYKSGQEGDWFLTGFSPRKQNLTLYLLSGFDKYNELMKKLGKHMTSKSCLYINDLHNINLTVLKELIKQSFTYMKNRSAIN